MKLIARATVATTLAMFAGTAAFAQDAVKVDPKHYTVLVDNAQVRVLKIHYGPHETSVMHSHPNSVITYLSDANNSFLLANGKTIKDVARPEPRRGRRAGRTSRPTFRASRWTRF